MTVTVLEIEKQGFALARGIISAKEIEDLKTLFAHADVARAKRAGKTFGARNLLGLPLVRHVAASPKLAANLSALLGDGFLAVRGIFFDKTTGANWPVPWHQDLSLAIRNRRDLPGWRNWSTKGGVLHVQPPAEILARMVTVRLHLDDCSETNGPLRLIAGSHRAGLLSRDAIQDREMSGEKAVIAQAGDALFMRPLILHASSPAQIPGHRRVVHIEFAPAGLLPAELDWAETA